MLEDVFTVFVEQSPVSVMMRALMEHIFRPERLNEIFVTDTKVQYTRELLFSTLVNLLSFVVCGIQPSVNAAYKAQVIPPLTNNSSTLPQKPMHTRKLPIRRELYQPMLYRVLIAKPGVAW